MNALGLKLTWMDLFGCFAMSSFSTSFLANLFLSTLSPLTFPEAWRLDSCSVFYCHLHEIYEAPTYSHSSPKVSVVISTWSVGSSASTALAVLLRMYAPP